MTLLIVLIRAGDYKKENILAYILLFAVFIIATCGLVYELICGTVASYLLGDSVTQFSTIIGVYLFSMGIGSWITRYVKKNLLQFFVQVELLIGLVGGNAAAILFLSFEYVESFRIILYAIVSITGILVGFEIPLLMRILKDNLEFSDLVSKIFTFDYVGALIASLLFPLVLVPHLGLIRSCYLFGILNVAVAIWTLYLFKDKLSVSKFLFPLSYLLLIGLVIGCVYSEKILSFSESNAYPDKVIYSKSTPYQRIVLTNSGHDLRLFLNGNLQFSSRDEYRYHEALVHVGLSKIPQAKNILLMGGGDGLAIREVLKYPSVQSITLVDLDKQMTNLFSTQKFLLELNHDSLKSPKVKVISQDAFLWLRNNHKKFDFIIVDFPDPSNFSLGKLYSNKFYKTLKTALNEDGAIVIQSTSPYYAKKSYWCVVNTLKASGFQVAPYHAYVPSFGDWGYVLASFNPLSSHADYPPGLRFIKSEVEKSMFEFPDDMKVKDVCVNKLNNQNLVRIFEEEWSEYVQAH